MKTNIPVQEEAEAINWSTHQIVRCNTAAAVIESNAKVCVEALTKPSSADQWRISVLSQDTLRVANMTKNVSFNWTPGGSNKAAHVLASWSLCNRLFGCFVMGAAPVFEEVIISEQPHLVQL